MSFLCKSLRSESKLLFVVGCGYFIHYHVISYLSLTRFWLVAEIGGLQSQELCKGLSLGDTTSRIRSTANGNRMQHSFVLLCPGPPLVVQEKLGHETIAMRCRGLAEKTIQFQCQRCTDNPFIDRILPKIFGICFLCLVSGGWVFKDFFHLHPKNTKMQVGSLNPEDGFSWFLTKDPSTHWCSSKTTLYIPGN